jgi:molybdopterin-synthase adenylyltransferase
MIRTSIVLLESDWQSVRAALLTPDGCENAGVLLCGNSQLHNERRLLAREFVTVPAEQYIERQSYHLEVAPSFYNDIVTRCLKQKLTPVIVHSHPFHGEAIYSSSDDYGEERLLHALNTLLPETPPASLVLSHTSVTGREFRKGHFIPLRSLSIIGARISTIYFQRLRFRKKPIEERFDRQIRAFGEEGQLILNGLRIAVVGLGGIGSIVAEQLVRAGVTDLILIDFDKLEPSNLSRVFGASDRDIGRPKVRVIAKHLESLGAKVAAADASAIRQPVLSTLRDRDIVFSCVDNDLTRAVLNRFAHQYFIPVIDHGIRLDGRSGEVTAAAGRVTIVGPGFTCLRCSHHLNPERIRAESMPQEDRAKLEREGYVMGIDDPAPAVVSLNTVVAGLGATAGINLFVGLTGKPQPASQMYDATSGSVFPVSPVHERGCEICDQAGVKGLGDLQIVSAYE